MLIGKEGVTLMTEEEFKEILDKEETDTVEFKSWINARNMKEIISLESKFCIQQRSILCKPVKIYNIIRIIKNDR